MVQWYIPPLVFPGRNDCELQTVVNYYSSESITTVKKGFTVQAPKFQFSVQQKKKNVLLKKIFVLACSRNEKQFSNNLDIQFISLSFSNKFFYDLRK
jgi:hypothetical protein